MGHLAIMWFRTNGFESLYQKPDDENLLPEPLSNSEDNSILEHPHLVKNAVFVGGLNLTHEQPPCILDGNNFFV